MCLNFKCVNTYSARGKRAAMSTSVNTFTLSTLGKKKEEHIESIFTYAKAF